MDGKPETLKLIKKNIKEKFIISESGRVNKFLGVYYKSDHDAKGKYAKMTMEKDVKNLKQCYKKYTGSDLRVQKTPGALGKTQSKIDLEEPDNINKYRSFMGHLIWYTTKVGPEAESQQGSWRCT